MTAAAARRLLAAVCWLAPVLAAQAQPAQVEGQFRSKTTRLQVLVLDPAEGVVAASTAVVSGACSGTVSGIGLLRDGVLRFAPYRPEPDGGRCAVTVRFDPRHHSAKVVAEGCARYSGAACGWEGDTLLRMR